MLGTNPDQTNTNRADNGRSLRVNIILEDGGLDLCCDVDREGGDDCSINLLIRWIDSP